MKKNKLKGLFTIFFALAMVVSVGITLPLLKANNEPQIVLAEGEEKSDESEETPKEDSENEEEASSSDDSIEPASEGLESSEQSSSEESSQESSAARPSISFKDIMKLIFQAFKDAIKDLIHHIDKWFMN